MPLHPDGDHAGGGGGAAGGAAGGRGARGGGARPSAQARGGRGQGRGCTVCTGPDLVTQLRIVGWLLIRRVRVFRPLFVELGLLLFAARSAPANALGARRFLLASLLAVPFPVGARCVSRRSATAPNMTLRRIFLLALAFVSSSAFIAVPPVRAPQLAGHCPETLRRPAAPARVGNPKMVRIASGGERDAIEDAVHIFKDAVRAKEAGDLDEADAIFTQATDLITAALDAARANGSVDDVDGLGFVLGTPTRPRGTYVEAITFAIFHCVIFVGTTALLTSPIFSVLSYPVLGGRPLYRSCQ